MVIQCSYKTVITFFNMQFFLAIKAPLIETFLNLNALYLPFMLIYIPDDGIVGFLFRNY